MAKSNYEAKKIMLKNVRLSFPSLYKTEIYQGNDTKKYSGTFVFSKDNVENYNKIDAEIKACLKANEKKVLPPGNICLKDGDQSGKEYLEGLYSIKASNKLLPTYIDKKRLPVTEDDDIFYAGCYVNVQLTLWYQDNGFGQKINANLLGVQFVAHGEPFGGGGEVSVADDFEEYEDDDDDDGFV